MIMGVYFRQEKEADMALLKKTTAITEKADLSFSDFIKLILQDVDEILKNKKYKVHKIIS